MYRQFADPWTQVPQTLNELANNLPGTRQEPPNNPQCITANERCPQKCDTQFVMRKVNSTDTNAQRKCTNILVVETVTLLRILLRRGSPFLTSPSVYFQQRTSGIKLQDPRCSKTYELFRIRWLSGPRRAPVHSATFCEHTLHHWQNIIEDTHTYTHFQTSITITEFRE
jgi:hypothetical protein